jgi:hypothetical protein
VLAVAVPLVAGFEEGKTFSDIFFSFLAKCLQKRVAFVCVCVCGCKERVQRGNVKGREERDNVPTKDGMLTADQSWNLAKQSL